MQLIIAPINPNGTGPNIANLIEGLLLLIERGTIKTSAAPGRPTPDELKQLATKARQDLAQQFFGEAVKRLVWDFQIQQGLGDNVGGVVEDKTAARMNEILRSLGVDLDTQDYEVLGTVSNESGRALSQLLVQAFDRDLRREELLGAAQTDAKGQYQIRYVPAQFKRAEKANADLLVRVFTADGKTELAVSATLFNAPPRAVIDLSVPAAALHTDSEWERYLRELGPLLETLQLHQLTVTTCSFWSAKPASIPRTCAWSGLMPSGASSRPN